MIRSDLTPAQTAFLDQAHAGAMAEQAALVAAARDVIAEHGPMLGAHMLAKKLDASSNPRRTLAALAALALARIVELEDRNG